VGGRGDILYRTLRGAHQKVSWILAKFQDVHSHVAINRAKKIIHERTAARARLVSARSLPEPEGLVGEYSEKDRNSLGEQQIT
jgi:hypothetical protein